MTIFELINKGAKLLSENLQNINCRFESELLLSFVLKKERIYLLIHNNETIDEKTADIFFSYINRRAKGEPFAYITGKKEFMSLEFSVCPGVLIPRPDTETLVTYVVNIFKGKNPHILDLCTGSGAIAISLAKYIPGSSVTAVDISDVCIEKSRENAKNNSVEDRVNIIKADVLHNFSSNVKFDCIVSNPPYIKSHIIPSLMKDVKDFEPSLALDGGDDGLVFYRKISALATTLLKPNGLLAFEIGHDQSDEVADILNANGFKNIGFSKDLSEINRVVYGNM